LETILLKVRDNYPIYCVGKTNLHRKLKNNRKETSEILFTKKYLYDEK